MEKTSLSDALIKVKWYPYSFKRESLQYGIINRKTCVSVISIEKSF